MKITLSDKPSKVKLKDAVAGKFYVDSRNRLWFCTLDTATCLTEYSSTFPNRYNSEVEVTEVAAGTTIMIVTD